MAMTDIKWREKVIEEFYTQCTVCKKEFTGRSEKQIKANFNQHKCEVQG